MISAHGEKGEKIMTLEKTKKEMVKFVERKTTLRPAFVDPILNAVEVVRCKDCKFNYANQIPSDDACQLCVELPISKEFYCAYGETTAWTPPKRMCNKEGIMCEFATEFGYCKITGCVHRTINYSVQDGGKDETL